MKRKKALKLTIKLWSWLAEDGERKKCNFPEFDKEYAHLEDYCPLCEKYKKVIFMGIDCGKCPISVAGENCFYSDSLFQQWSHNLGPLAREDAAQGIVSICMEALKGGK